MPGIRPCQHCGKQISQTCCLCRTSSHVRLSYRSVGGQELELVNFPGLPAASHEIHRCGVAFPCRLCKALGVLLDTFRRKEDMLKPSPLPGPRQSNFQARKLLRTGTRHPRLKGDSRPEEGWPVTNWKDVDGGKPGLILLPHECAAILAVCPRPQSARNTR